MRRYVWSPKSSVYHDRLYATEQCNRDDMVGRRQSDTPPENKRLCSRCQKKREWARNSHPDLRRRTTPQNQ